MEEEIELKMHYLDPPPIPSEELFEWGIVRTYIMTRKEYEALISCSSGSEINRK